MPAVRYATPRSARAALQLGPVEARCNVCGDVHALPQADPDLASAADWRNWGAAHYHIHRCVARRLASGIISASVRPLHDALAHAAARDRYEGAVYLSGRRNDQLDVFLESYTDFCNATGTVGGWVRLHDSASSFIERPRFTMGFFEFYYAARCMAHHAGVDPVRMRCIDSSLPDSAWTLALAPQDANRAVARIYLDIMLDPAMWARVARMLDLTLSEWRAAAHHAGRMRGGIESALACAIEEHDAMQQAAARMRGQEGIVYAALGLCL